MSTDLTDEIPFTLLERYAAGECSASERAQVEQWMDAHPDRRQHIASLQRIGESWQKQTPRYDAAAAWTAAVPRVRAQQINAPPTRRIWPRWTVAGAGAAVVASLMILLGVERSFNHNQPFREFVSPAGSRTTVTLRDGSTITLGPASHLRVAEDFGRHDRALELDGEAYFAVHHDVWHPLTVRVGRATITDVGTEFDVRAYDANLRVAVAEGEVSLRSQPPLPLTPSPVAFGAGRGNGLFGPWRAARTRPLQRHDTSSFGDMVVGAETTTNSNVYLTAGDVAEATDTGFTVTHQADVAALTAWRQGTLTFRDASVAEVARTIERTFGLTVTVADSALAHQRLSASFSSESADEILDDITAVVGARYERTGRMVVIQRQSAGTTKTGHQKPLPLQTAKSL